MESPVNSDGNDMHASITSGGTWLASNREGGVGRSDIYYVSGTNKATLLQAPLNDERSQPDLWVSDDESWMILVITDHPTGFGGDDLYVSNKVGEAWSDPVNLGRGINTAEYGPSVSPDGEFLFFTSHRAGSSHIYRVPIRTVCGVRD